MDDFSSHDSDQHYHAAVQTDREGFVRLTCSYCGLDFKVEPDVAKLQHVLDTQIRRVKPEASEALVESDESSRLTCPYCSHQDEITEMHTEETMTYFRQIVQREVVAPMLNDFVEEIGRIWESGNRGSSGVISFEANTSRQKLPQRPLHGPEPPDMKVVEFLCCDKRAKIYDHWYAVDRCPFCETNVRLT